MQNQNHIKTFTASSGNQTLISVKAKDLNYTPPVDKVVVVDISGSMGSPCTAQDENGQAMENGFTVLDIVKHATKTVVKTLRP